MTITNPPSVLCLNPGSSTLKFDLLEPDGGRTTGQLDRVGRLARCSYADGTRAEHSVAFDDAQAATAWVIEHLLQDPPEDLAVGYRVVHGGPTLRTPTRIDEAVLARIEAATRLAPLHNGPALTVIRAAREQLPRARHVAVFDTGFHHTLPESAARYAIDTDLADRHGLRRYGFHGLAHQSMTRSAAALLGRPAEALRLVTLQLGSGCSAAAIEGGRSIETTMGLTPLEGLMMGTRSGDVDPAVVRCLAEGEGVDAATVEGWLNHRSGLLGVSGLSADLRDVLVAADAGHPRATLAIEMFCHRVVKAIGSALAVLGGADAIVFGGGVGENAAPVRRRVLARFAWAGVALDEDLNEQVRGREGRITTEDSRTAALVALVDEGREIARAVHACLQTAG